MRPDVADFVPGTGAGAGASVPSSPHIQIDDLVIGYGGAVVVEGISFTVQRGETLTLLGPSGCGKTTTLRAIAGLEKPSSGSITVGGRLVYSSAKRIDVAVERRGLSMVFQSYGIWPHMSVFDNVAYGLRVRNASHAEIDQKVHAALDLVQMGGFAQRPASRLSGGQQQRIAMARAIAFSPEVLLFDEPLSNLDAKLRGEMRIELRELQRRLGITSVYVTHDQEEALAISDRIIVMKSGRIEQIGTPQEIYDRPRTNFVTESIGSVNLIDGELRGTQGTEMLFEAKGGIVLRTAAARRVEGADSRLAIRTACIKLGEQSVQAGDNRAPGRVKRRLFCGDFIQYVVDWPAGTLAVRRPPTELWSEGDEVTISFSSDHCVLTA